MTKKVDRWSLFFLRVVIGLIFIIHGYTKLFGGLEQTSSFLAQLGIPLASLFAVLIAILELFGGIFLIIGLFKRWTAALLTLEMLVAFLLVHLKNGFLISNGGYEFIILIIASLLVITNSK
tara:strand:+ start:882 stop:1244 length:363 start_codon:yes stop_codon:yes gene_type:complete